MPRIAVVFTGGTISMRATTGTGNKPALAGRALVDSVPQLHDLAELQIVDWGLVPGSHLTFDNVLDIGRVLSTKLSSPDIDGVVVVQGTDNIEETAFAWDLMPLPEKPVIVVGAMRSASQRGYDGPENLLNAVGAAACSDLAGMGVLVAMAGELHSADVVVKTHTHAYETFKSLRSGRIGLVVEGVVHVERSRLPFRLHAMPERAARVPLVTAVLGGDESTGALLHGDPPEGLVVAAMGGGNTQAELLELARELLDRGTHVVLTTRASSGQVRAGYAFPGGSTTWWDAGAIFAGTLGGLKSRVALSLAVGAGSARTQIVDLFASFGGGARG